MKKLNYLLLALCLSVSTMIVSCGDTETKQEVSEETHGSEAEGSVVFIAIEGMTCGGCAQGIHEALIETKGVYSAEVSFESGSAKVDYDQEQVTEEELVKLVTSLNEGKYTAALKNDHHGCEPGCKKACCSKEDHAKKCEPGCEKPCCKKEEHVKACVPGTEKPCCKKGEEHKKACAHGEEDAGKKCDHAHQESAKAKECAKCTPDCKKLCEEKGLDKCDPEQCKKMGCEA